MGNQVVCAGALEAALPNLLRPKSLLEGLPPLVEQLFIILAGFSRPVKHVVADEIKRREWLPEAVERGEDFLRVVVLVKVNKDYLKPVQKSRQHGFKHHVGGLVLFFDAVGNETREWRMGEAWVFDDTIEHEAWNDADELRVILIFDVWNPFLAPHERDLIATLMLARNQFYDT